MMSSPFCVGRALGKHGYIQHYHLCQSDELHFISDSLECRDNGTFILFVDEVFDGIGVQYFKERLDLRTVLIALTDDKDVDIR